VSRGREVPQNRRSPKRRQGTRKAQRAEKKREAEVKVYSLHLFPVGETAASPQGAPHRENPPMKTRAQQSTMYPQKRRNENLKPIEKVGYNGEQKLRHSSLRET